MKGPPPAAVEIRRRKLMTHDRQLYDYIEALVAARELERAGGDASGALDNYGAANRGMGRGRPLAGTQGRDQGARMSEIKDPGAPGDYLTNNLSVAEGSVLKMEDGVAEPVTWLVFDARATDSPDNTVRHCYALSDDQLLATIGMLYRRARERGLA